MRNNKPKRGVLKVKPTPVDPGSLPDPVEPGDYVRRGMVLFARKQYEAAVEDLKKAITLNPRAEDGYYGLGMVYKAMKKDTAAVEAFQNVIQILSGDTTESHDRKVMLRRLALGHINEINTGDWNLEKEIWIYTP